MKQNKFRNYQPKGVVTASLGLMILFGGVTTAAYAVEPPAASYAAPEAKTHQLQGTVYDENGEPVIGASVMVKGTSIGTATNLEGDFVLNVPSKGILVVSYVGYKSQEIVLKGQRKIDIHLEVDAGSLDEVVVVGYGVQKKATLTGSVSSVGGEDIKKVSAANLSNTLAGKTAVKYSHVSDRLEWCFLN